MRNVTHPISSVQASFRIHIQAIDVDLTTSPEYPICLKLLLNEHVDQLLREIPATEPLHWDVLKPINAEPMDYVELRIYEAHWLRRRVRIGSVRFRASQVDSDTTELNVNDNTGLVPCSVKFSFPHPQTASYAHGAQKAATLVASSPSVLVSMGRTRDLVNAILSIGQRVSELVPMAKATLDLCTQAWEILEKQESCDIHVAELVTGMGDMLPFVDVMKNQAKVAELQLTIVEMLNVIEDGARFVIEYRSDGVTARVVRGLVTSVPQRRVGELLKRFKDLKEAFDRGMLIQAVQEVGTLLDDADRDILTSLETLGARHNTSAGCLEGTRERIRKEIIEWIDNSDASQSLFWLFGLAGCGKSTVVRSICDELDRTDRLAATFFCKRDNEPLSKAENVVSTLAANLGYACQPYGAKLVATLRQKPKLRNSPVGERFQGMILEPIRAMDMVAQSHTSVIVIDALDECGEVDIRTQLAGFLFQLSQLAPWIKVILTSRPNEELVRFFEKKEEQVLRCNLFQEDLALVSNDISVLIRHRLTQLINDDEELSLRGWLEDGTVGRLATRANGLFIWAQTACNVICNSLDPGAKITEMLSGEFSRDVNMQLDALYSTVLDEALGGVVDGAHIIRSCIAAVVITRIPLVDTALAELMHDRVSLIALRSVIRRLASVLYRDDYGAVRVLHQSFCEYMGNRCSMEYCIVKDNENLSIATSCLRILAKELRFNICGLEDSRMYNSQVPDRSIRIQSNVPPHLEYSCTYWASHLAEAPTFRATAQANQPVLHLLKLLLFGPRILFWIEILSLLGKLYVSESNLLELEHWIQDPGHEISIYATELQRFVSAFYLPVSQSVPQLYISAVSIGSAQFKSIRMLKDRFPNTLEILRGKHLGKLSNGWLKVIPHPSRLNTISYSPDGRLIATGCSDGMVRIWDALTGASALDPLQGHSKGVTSVVFSPDGQRVASGSRDTMIRVWDVRSGAAIFDPLQGHSDVVMSVAFSPDGLHIASSARDMTVQLWNARTGAPELSPLKGHSKAVSSVTFSPDGKQIISGSLDMSVRMWDAASAAAVLDPFHGHTSWVTSVACSPGGQQIVSGSHDMTLRIWDPCTGAGVLAPFQGHSGDITSVAFSPDGQRIVSGSDDKTIRVWDSHTGAPALDPLWGHFESVSSVAFSPDGQRIASGSYDKTVRVWDVRSNPAALDPLQGHYNWVTSVAFSPDGQRIVSGSWDQTVRVWDAQTGAPVLKPIEGHNSVVTSVAFSPDSRRIVSGSEDRTVRIWDARTGAVAPHQLQHTTSVTSVSFSPNGQHIVSCSQDQKVRVWDAYTGGIIFTPLSGHSSAVTSVVYSPDGQFIVSGSKDKTLRVWDASTGAAIFDPLRGHTSWVTCVAFSPDGLNIVSGSWDQTVQIWDALTGAAVLDPIEGHSNWVTTVAFSPDGQSIVSGSWDKSLRLWDARTGAAIGGPLTGHSHAVTSVAFSPDGQRIVSGSWDGTVRMWDVSSIGSLAQEPLVDLPFPTPFGSHVMSYQLASSLNYDGWVLDRQGKPLFWLPEVYQRQKVDNSLLAISTEALDHPVSFDFSKFKYGTEWASVYSSSVVDS